MGGAHIFKEPARHAGAAREEVKAVYTTCLRVRGERVGVVCLPEVRLVELMEMESTRRVKGLENARDVPSTVGNTIICKEEKQNVPTEPLKARLHTKLCVHFIRNYLGAHVSDTRWSKGLQR